MFPLWSHSKTHSDDFLSPKGRALGSESGGLDLDPGSKDNLLGDLEPRVQLSRLPPHLESEQSDCMISQGSVAPVPFPLLGSEKTVGFFFHSVDSCVYPC